jgi:hypothetical protein
MGSEIYVSGNERADNTNTLHGSRLKQLPVRAVCGTSRVRPHTHVTTSGNCAVPPWQAINFERSLFEASLSRRTCISCAGLTIARATTSSLNQRCSPRELCGQEVQREARGTSAAMSESSSRTSSRTFRSSDTVTVLGSFRETAFLVEAGLTGDYVPARV